MSAILHSINLASYYDMNSSFINVSTLGDLTINDFVKCFEDTFQDEIKSGKLSTCISSSGTGTILIIKGMLLWDYIPVTRMEFSFDKYSILIHISSDILSFAKVESIFDCAKITPSLTFFPKILRKDSFSSKNNILEYTIMHYVNAEKKIQVHSDNTVSMSLLMCPNFFYTFNYNFALRFSATGKTSPIYEGLPVLIKGATAVECFSFTGISCESLDYKYIEKSKEGNIWYFTSPAFLVVGNQFFAIEHLELIPYNAVDGGWEIMKIKLARHDFVNVSHSDFIDKLFSTVFNKAKFQNLYNISIEGDDTIILSLN